MSQAEQADINTEPKLDEAAARTEFSATPQISKIEAVRRLVAGARE
jgi:hypothetical protein